jgi:hypothetical protein
MGNKPKLKADHPEGRTNYDANPRALRPDDPGSSPEWHLTVKAYRAQNEAFVAAMLEEHPERETRLKG